MPTHDEHILRILSESEEPLFASEITDRLNAAMTIGNWYTIPYVVSRLKAMADWVKQDPDGRWRLKGISQ